LLIEVTIDIFQEWFFYDGVHGGTNVLEQGISNTRFHEYFVAITEKRKMFACFEGQRLRPTDIINGLRSYTGKISDINLKEALVCFLYRLVGFLNQRF
jgi:hypothetical protein